MSTPAGPTPPENSGGVHPTTPYPVPFGNPEEYAQQYLQPNPYVADPYAPSAYVPGPYAPDPYAQPAHAGYVTGPGQQGGFDQTPQGVNGLAIASLVAAFLLPPLGILFGHLALSQIRSRNEDGRGLAVAGLVLSYLFTVLIVVATVIAVVLLVALARTWDDYVQRASLEGRSVGTDTVCCTTHSVSDAGFVLPATTSSNGARDAAWAGVVVRLAVS